MSDQPGDWRERLHADPSRMEQELATKLQDDRIAISRVTILSVGVHPSYQNSKG